MPNDNNDTTAHNPTDDQAQASPTSAHSKAEGDWNDPLWDDGWEGQTGLFGEVHLCVATKQWPDGTVDVLVAHDPFDGGNVATAYAHRHTDDAPSVTAHGSADDIVKIVTSVWVPPQQEQISQQS